MARRASGRGTPPPEARGAYPYHAGGVRGGEQGPHIPEESRAFDKREGVDWW